jgi:release factor glutamine methyltransferase
MDTAITTVLRPARLDQLIAAAAAALDAAGVGTPRLDAELLLAAACAVDRTALYVRGREPMPSRSVDTFRSFVARRRGRGPRPYIVGRQEFWSLEFAVTPSVLIPRPETELLVELALGAARGARHGVPLRLCDVGTGSGCIAVALARELPSADVWALDVSMRALAVAELNAQRLGGAERVRFLRSDLFASVAHQQFDIILANPPYLTGDDLADLQPEVAFEPRSALDGGADGLTIMRRLLGTAPHRLAEGGWLLIEIGSEQAAAVGSLARAAGFSTISIRSDYAGLPRVLMARR